MYLPIMRGKQNELIALRELAEILSHEDFKPIIEPVKLNLIPLIRSVQTLNQHSIIPIIIINPHLGQFSKTSVNLISELNNSEIDYVPCVKVTGNDNQEYRNIINGITTEKAVYIYGGLDTENIRLLSNVEYAIVDKDSPDIAISQLTNVVLMTDAFQKKTRNADYTDSSYFSDSHISYKTKNNVIGFGDYTMVGSEYSERGGPAYVVTIHLSYINQSHFNAMYIKHFSSEDNQSPVDPGGKFNEALTQLINYTNSNPHVFVETSGLVDFKKLYQQQHFPGLGVIKKISMKHHIETICSHI